MLPSLYGSENGGADKRFISTDDTSMSQFFNVISIIVCLICFEVQENYPLIGVDDE